MAGIKKNRSPRKATRLLQSRLKFARGAGTLKKCIECQMSYIADSPADCTEHKKYHDLHLYGKKWLLSWGTAIQDTTSSQYITPPSTSGSNGSGSGAKGEREDYIAYITPGKAAEVKAMMEIMYIVNNELTAPHDENAFWSEEGTSSRGRAFVYIKDGRAVGAVTVEYLKEDDGRGRWMRVSTRELVPEVVPRVRLGISRIWVCRKQRGKGIATRLLECVRKYAILGNEVARWEMAWSQPSESGGKLATRYNSVRHKSGELLIPCYI
ncbi:AaceriAEL024Cp [[Ashbya] aceris (nom. inval.)]|nr:AaceriAEL024Cp [[Ashbya] aceris (nom. inval.)]